jgi:hypothetical protein
VSFRCSVFESRLVCAIAPIPACHHRLTITSSLLHLAILEHEKLRGTRSSREAGAPAETVEVQQLAGAGDPVDAKAEARATSGAGLTNVNPVSLSGHLKLDGCYSTLTARFAPRLATRRQQ